MTAASPPPLPNLVIGGAQKSGTTSLHFLLAKHPRVYFPARPQEIHFFDLDASYARGLEWYRRLFRGWAGEPVVGQTSPLYLFEPAVPLRLQAALPEARLLFILRHPAERAYSHYWHEVRYGFETLPFDQALDREAERLRDGFEARRHYSYQARGRYGEQLARFLERFPRQQVLVLLQDHLRADAPALLRRCTDFLGLEPLAADTGSEKRRYNPSLQPRVPALQRLVRHWRERWPRLGYLVDAVNLRQKPYPPMAPAVRQRLEPLVAAEVAALHRLAGVDARCWLGDGA